MAARTVWQCIVFRVRRAFRSFFLSLSTAFLARFKMQVEMGVLQKESGKKVSGVEMR